jgi:3-methyladenine DNA glycosylase AlkD
MFLFDTISYMLLRLQAETKQLSDPQKAKFLAGFFKTGKGQYGEGDIFYGITVPVSRKISRKYTGISLAEIDSLLQSKVHEERLIALLILVAKFKNANESEKKQIYEFYLAHTAFINNWDLVDLTAPRIVGAYLYAQNGGQRAENVLKQLAHSESLWDKRIAMIATLAFIVKGKAEPCLTIADILLHDKHDLLQKAVGWMLREVGKRVSLEAEEEFLKSRYKTMPRTALRYAIERFDERHRKDYLLGVI